MGRRRQRLVGVATPSFFLVLVGLGLPGIAFGQSGGWRMIGQIGGPTQAVAVEGKYAYVGVGLRLVVLDVSNPAQLRQVGATAPFPHFVEGVAVSGTLAYVAAGGAGLRVVDVADPTRPTEVGAWDSRGYAEGIAVAGATAYLADGPYGLRVVDVSNPARPKEVGSAYVMNYAFEVAVAGRYAYIAAAGAGLLVADMSNPARPVEMSTLDTPGYAYGVAVAGSTVFVADGWEGLNVVNVADPARPIQLGFHRTPGWAFSVGISGTLLYVADGFRGTRVLDASNPAQPRELGAYEVSGGHAGNVAVAGSIAYVADRNWGLHAVNVSEPARPARMGFYGPLGYADAVAVQGNYAYVAAGTYGLRIVDVSNPANPRPVGVYDTEGYATSVAALGRYAYACTGSAGSSLHVVDISDPLRPARTAKVQVRTGVCRDMEVVGETAYIADEWGLELLSVSDPRRPEPLGFIRLWQWVGAPDAVVGVTVSGTLAYLASELAGLEIVSVSDPRNPVWMGAYNSGTGSAQDVLVVGSRAYLAENDGVRVVDVSDLARPVGLGFYKTGGEVYGLAVSNGTVCAANGSRGVSAIDFSNPSSPRLLAAFDTPGYVWHVAVVGNRLYLADGPNGLLILEKGTGSVATGAMVGLADGEGSRDILPVGAGGPRWEIPGSSKAHPAEYPVQRPVAGAAAATGTCVVNSASDSGPATLRACIQNAASGSTITFDASIFPPARPATIALAAPLPPINQGRVTLDASDAGVVLDGSQLSGRASGLVLGSGNVVRGLQIIGFPSDGITIYGQDNVIGGDRARGRGPLGQGNVISGNRENGIFIAGEAARGNVVTGNLIGLDATGSRALGNSGIGVFICGGAAHNRIGGTEARERNIISGNGGNGVSLMDKGNSNVIVGNYVGTDVTGTIDLGNRGHGISMELAGFNNLIQRNLASGNVRAGVCLSDHGSNYNVVVGNLIGTDASGTKAIPNDWCGVFIGFMGASFNRVGGTRPEERNVISGNPAGVVLYGPGAVGNFVLGNLIGTDTSGTHLLGNATGVLLGPGIPTVVGGATEQERNVISGNGSQGVAVTSDYNTVLGNYIGTDASGRTALGNSGVGVSVSGGHNAIQGNLVAHTTNGAGVSVHSNAYNPLRRNSIHSNARKGIALSNRGNNMLPAPLVTAVASTAVWGIACPACEVELFSDAEGQGRIFEGSTVAGASGAFAFEKGSPLTGPNITATGTDAEGNTSEFSQPRKLVPTAGPLVNVSAASYAGDPLAVESIVTAFGSNLASGTEQPAALPLPTTLAGTSVKVLDSAGVERAAPLYFVSPAQVNYQIPPGTALGLATVAVANEAGIEYAASVEIVSVAPGLFSASGTGQGLAAANVLRVKADGSQIYEPVTQPIDLGPETDQVYLLLYGTGIRRRSSLGAVRVSIGGTDAPVSYAGPQPEYPGLDQVNILLPRMLSGRGEVDVALRVDGKAANVVRVSVR